MDKPIERDNRGESDRARPGSGMMASFEEMERALEAFFPRGWFRHFDPPSRRWLGRAVREEVLYPRVDIIDRDEQIVVRANVPGVEREDLEVEVNDHLVNIRGSTHRRDEEETGDFVRCETEHGEFSRTLTLPVEVDRNRAKATFRDGVLELTLPKVSESRRRSVPIA